MQRSADESQAFVEKLWAMRRVGQIIDEVDLHGKNQELIDELHQQDAVEVEYEEEQDNESDSDGN